MYEYEHFIYTNFILQDIGQRKYTRANRRFVVITGMVPVMFDRVALGDL